MYLSKVIKEVSVDCCLLGLVIIIFDKDFFGSVNLLKLILCIFLNVGGSIAILNTVSRIQLLYVIEEWYKLCKLWQLLPVLLCTHIACVADKGS